MTVQGIKELHVQGFGCLQSVTFTLSPLHALIGPNDTGKSTVLRVLQGFGQLIANSNTSNTYLETLLAGDSTIRAHSHPNPGTVELIRTEHGKSIKVDLGVYDARTFPERSVPVGPAYSIGPERAAVIKAMTGALLLRLDPDVLRQDSNLIKHDQPLVFQDEYGKGLAGIYDAILTRDTDRFTAINKRVKELFPAVAKISLRNTSNSTKALAFTLLDGKEIGAKSASEGLLYFLAFMALESFDKPALLLVEEPETGLHPSRIKEVMDILREISQSMQVVLATHSPLVINELKGHEVSVMTRDSTTGASVRRLSETPDFEERSKIYALGELWVSYADGKSEAPLLKGSLRA